MKKAWKIGGLVAGGVVVVLVVLFVFVLADREPQHETDPVVEEPQEPTKELLYGIAIDDYDIAENTVQIGETLGQILGRFGVSAGVVDRIVRASEPVFDLRGIKAGQRSISGG